MCFFVAQNVVSLGECPCELEENVCSAQWKPSRDVGYIQLIDGGVELLEKTPRSKIEQGTKRVEKITAF